MRSTASPLGSGKIRVRQSKTSAGVRTVDVQPELRDELLTWKATTRHGEPGDFVFPTSTGRADNRNNVRRRGSYAPWGARTSVSSSTTAASRCP